MKGNVLLYNCELCSLENFNELIGVICRALTLVLEKKNSMCSLFCILIMFIKTSIITLFMKSTIITKSRESV